MTIHAFIEKVGRKIKFWIRYIYELYFAHGLYKYSSYEEYVRVQTVTNLQKEDWIWTSEKNIGPLGEYIRKMIPDSKFGICHGVRNGTELEWFAKYTGAKVIGTEISPSANKYKNVIQWDFHEPNPEWVGKADFVYTNALDHAYNPEKAVDTWMAQLKPGGICIIDWCHKSNVSTMTDPFGASFRQYKKLFNKKYRVVDILRGASARKPYHFVIKRK